MTVNKRGRTVPKMLNYDFIILGATGFTGRWVVEEERVLFDP